MRSPVPERILKIIDDMDEQGNVSLTRLTVLKAWFEHPRRLSNFGLWIARRAAGRKGKTTGQAGDLLNEARVLLHPGATRESFMKPLDRRAATSLLDRARDSQNEFQKQRWGMVRIIHCWPLLLVEKGLELHLGQTDSPSDGYKLAADWAQHYDPSHGNGLNGPSRGKLHELVRFMFNVEALEEPIRRPTPCSPGMKRALAPRQ